jgi:predicted permease
MLFGFAANLDLSDVFSWGFVWAYLLASTLIWALVGAGALLRGTGREEAVFEAHTGVIGNVGFLGIPMLALLLGPQAVGPVLMVLAVDLVVFSTVLTLIITGLRGGTVGLAMLGGLVMGLLRNPMIVSVVLGLAWGATGWALPVPVNEFMTTLGAAATPCALFAIGASLAGKNPDRVGVAVWLSFAKLVLHPAAVAVAALWLFDVEPYAAGVMIAAAALPVAGNVFILAQHYGVAPQRVSTSILISTAVSVLTVTAVIALLGPLVGKL